MKKCFMKKLLSSFLALTMVVTAVPANVVSAADGQAQVVKAQNNKPAAAKKASNWSGKAEAGIVAGCAALVLSVAAAVQASLYFKLNLAKKEIESPKNKVYGQSEQLKKQLDEAINQITSQIKGLTREVDVIGNNAKQTASKINEISSKVEDNANQTASQINELSSKVQNHDTLNGFFNAISGFGVAMPNLLAKLCWVSVTQGMGYAARNHGGQFLNGASTFLGNLFNRNSTKIID